jgi:hypothetical protein
MDENGKKELVKKLSFTKENLDVLCGMLKDEKRKAEQKAALANGALAAVTGALYELTGDEFYRGA